MASGLGYNTNPDLASTIRAMERRLATLERQTQQRAIPLARIGRSTAFLTDSNQKRFQFTELAFDTAGMWDAAQPARLTVPVTGVYLICAQACWSGNTSYGWGAITRNRPSGAAVYEPGTIVTPGIASPVTVYSPVGLVQCDVGDYLGLEVAHGQVGVELSMNANMNFLSVGWMGVGR